MQQGEELANTLMKLQTKALRRATLAFAGASALGLDNEMRNEVKTTNAASEVPSMIADAEAVQKTTPPPAKPKVDEPSLVSGKPVDPSVAEPEKPRDDLDKKIAQDEVVSDAEVVVTPDETVEQLKEEPKKKPRTRKAPAKKATSKKETKEEKIARGEEMLKENDDLSKEIKSEYSLDEVREETKEEPIKYDLFNGKERAHIGKLVELVADITGTKEWKTKHPNLVQFMQGKLMPAIHEKEAFLSEAGQVSPEFKKKLAQAVEGAL